MKTDTYISTETQNKIATVLHDYTDVPEDVLHNIEQIFQEDVYDKQPLSPQNILLIRLDEIGDMVMSSTSIKNVRAKYPDADITFVCSPWVKNMLTSCSDINRVMTVNKKTFKNVNSINVLKLFWSFSHKALLQYNFDTTIVLRHNEDAVFESAIAFMTGAVRRWGFDINASMWWRHLKPSRAFINNILMNRSVMLPYFVTHEADKQLYLMSRLGIPTKYKDLQLFFGKKDLERAKEWINTLSSTSIKVLIGIAASIKCRKYPVKRYLQVCQKLLKEYDVSFVIVGSDQEKDDAQFLERNLPEDKVLNLCCKTTLRETEAVISLTDFYIGNDTGIMHMASACKIPVVGLFRESPKQDQYPFASAVYLFAPYKTKSVILRPPKPIDDCANAEYFFGGCKHLNEPHCILQITVDDIVNAFKTLHNEIILERKNNKQ